MAHVFVSYVRDDQSYVDGLVAELRREGVDVWLDRDSIVPGSIWRDSLKRAIHEGAFFLACFSDTYYSRSQTFMEEELLVAAAVFATDRRSNPWLVPVRLSDCRIPEVGLGLGRTLRDLQWVDLFGDWAKGVRRLLSVVRPESVHHPDVDRVLRGFCERHIRAKLARDHLNGALRIKQIEDRWQELVSPAVWEPTLSLAVPLFVRMNRAVHPAPLTEVWDEHDPRGRMIAVTVSPTADSDTVFGSLVTSQATGPDAYREFLTRQRLRLRMGLDWEYRDFVHWVFAMDGPELTVDLLYWVNLKLNLILLGMLLERKKRGEPRAVIQSMYPGSLITVTAWESIFNDILRFETRLLHPDPKDRKSDSAC